MLPAQVQNPVQVAPNDAALMRLALAQADLAQAQGEVPVGAIVVKNGQVLGVGFNQNLHRHDPGAHAEIVALRRAARRMGNHRLDGCELFVTLEPCAMCCGAMLHARLQRVVFGAPDPKTGAAGSVLNLFEFEQLNHQTQVQGGVLAAECAQGLQNFFRARRNQQRTDKKMLHPLRDDALRTPDAAFDGLTAYPWAAHYLSHLPALGGLRMHYLDQGSQSAAMPAGQGQTTYLCLHGNPSWSYIYRKMIPVFLASGARVVAPDLPGFGKSDKPKKDSVHRFTWHRQVLLELVEKLELENIVLVVQDWGGLLGLTLPMAAPQRYKALVVMNTTLATGEAPLSPGFIAWRDMCAKNPQFDIARLFGRGNPQMSPAECAAYMAPFPDAGYRAGTRAFPALVPEFADSEGAEVSRQAASFWRDDWRGQTLMAIGEQDPVLGLPVMTALKNTIRNCPEPMVLPLAGHFVQEHGEPVAHAAVLMMSKATAA